MATATLEWTLPTTRTDGTPLDPTVIASVDVFDSAATDPSIAISSIAGPATSFTTGILSVGNHGFTVVVNDTTGHRSAPSNVAVVTVEAVLAAPSPVADLKATLNP